MKIFVTGGSGFVGGAVIKRLSKDHEIIVMSRSDASDTKIIAMGGVPVRCDLQNVKSVMMEGCDIVIHAAAYVEEWGVWEVYEEFNVKGTKNVLAAAKIAGVKRFIHIGTEAALFLGQNLIDVDETYPIAPYSPFPYSSTKALAEKVVIEANMGDFETISLRPRMIWGPGDQTILKVITEMANNGKFTWIDEGQYKTSTTHIDNLVHAIELAMVKGQSGEAYFILDDDVITIREFLTQYLATQNIDLGKKSTPAWLVRGLANTVEPIWRFAAIKSPPPITKFTAHIMSCHCILSDAKARKDLGYKPVISRVQGFAALS